MTVVRCLLSMKREEYLIYCLLYAIDAANVKKQNLVQMSLKTNAVTFVKIYNIIQQHDDATRKDTMASYADMFDKNEMVAEIKNTFLADLEPSIQENICNCL